VINAFLIEPSASNQLNVAHDANGVLLTNTQASAVSVVCVSRFQRLSFSIVIILFISVCHQGRYSSSVNENVFFNASVALVAAYDDDHHSVDTCDATLHHALFILVDEDIFAIYSNHSSSRSIAIVYILIFAAFACCAL
jgi:hypothetical protein